MQGWIKLHRKIAENPIWQDKPFSRGQAWVDLLIMANHDDNEFLFDGKLVEVEKGSLITSELKLMNRWGWSKSKLRYFLFTLESQQMIVKNTDRKKTTITICKYCDYQISETTEKPLKDHRKTTERPLKDTNKNEKNEKNEKNNNIPPSMEELTAYCAERNKGVDPKRWFDFYASKGWMVGKNKMVDWKSAVRTWEPKDEKPKTGLREVTESWTT